MDHTVITFARQRYLGRLLVLPAAVTVFVAMILPIGYAVVMSMFQYKMGGESNAVFVFLDNYIRFFGDKLAIHSLITTLVFSIAALSLELVIGTLIAVLLMSINVKAAGVFRTIFVVPLLISPIITALIWRYMYDPTYGLVYWLARQVGLGDFGGLSDPTTALASIIVVDVWHTTPFVILVVTSGLTTISEDIYEAAHTDGAGPGRILFQITLPLITGVLIVITIIRGMDAFRVFDVIYGMTNGGPADSTLSLSIYAYKQGFESFDMGYGITVSVIMMVILVLLFGPLMRRFNPSDSSNRKAIKEKGRSR